MNFINHVYHSFRTVRIQCGLQFVISYDKSSVLMQFISPYDFNGILYTKKIIHSRPVSQIYFNQEVLTDFKD